MAQKAPVPSISVSPASPAAENVEQSEKAHEAPRRSIESHAASEDHFGQAHGSTYLAWERRALKEHGHAPLTARHYFKPPIVRQWIHKTKLFKCKEDRNATYIELFYDLSFVSAQHLLADAAVEPEPRGINILRFIIVFFFAFSQWQVVVRFVNIHGTDDVPQRLSLLFRMLLVTGFCVTAIGIELERPEEEDGSFGGWEITEDSLENVYWAACWQLIAVLSQMVILLCYAISLPKFRWAFAYEEARLALPAIFLIPLAVRGVDSTQVILGLALASIAAEIIAHWSVGAIAHWRSKSGRGWDGYRFAHSIDHLLERSSAFVVLVLGESILQASFRAVGGEVGFHSEFGRAALGIIVAFLLLWLCFDADSSRVYIHAMRLYWSTAILHIQAQFIHIGALILSSAALANLVTESDSAEGFRWYYAGSIAVYLLSVLLIGLLHRSYDQRGSSLVPRYLRMAARAIAAAFIACVPLIDRLNNLEFLGVIASTLVVLVVFETVGKIGVIGDLEALKHDSDDAAQAGKPVKFDVEDLTDQEKGHEDAGIEDEIGAIQVVPLRISRRIAYTI